MSEHQQLCDLIADMIAAQRDTTEAVTKLAEAFAGIRAPAAAAKAETTKAIEKAKTEPVAPAPTPSVPSSTEAPAAAAPLDYQRDVSPSMSKLLAAKGAPAVVAIWKAVGATSKKDVAVEKLPEVLALAKQALGE